MRARHAAVLVLTLLAAAGAARAQQAEVAYPEGYRSWYHVKSLLIEQGHPLFEAFGGLHHIYANDAALAGYRTGTFPDGAVIVFDLLAVERTEDHAVIEKERKVLGVMQRDGVAFAATDGWGYEGFAGGNPQNRLVGAKAAEACHGCHASAAPDFVFSELRD